MGSGYSGADGFSAPINLDFGIRNADAIQAAEKALADVTTKQEALAQAFLNGEKTALQLRNAQNKLNAEQKAANDLIDQLTRQTTEYVAAQQAAQQAEQQRIASIEELGKRARAYAQAEREAEQAAREQRQAEGDALRARAEGYARAERAAEQAAAKQKQADGDAMRARIEAHARAEREQEAIDRLAADSARIAAQTQTQLAGEALRSRIDAYARAERVQENLDRQAVASAKAANDQKVAAAKKYEDAILLMARSEAAGYTNTATAVATANDKIKGSSNNAGYAILAMSNAVQDASFGFQGVINNIPQIVIGLGGGPGLAGVTMAAAVAFQAFRPHIVEVGVQIGIVADKTKAYAVTIDQMKEKLQALNDKPVKLKADFDQIDALTKRIEKAERDLSAYEAAAKRLSKPENESSQRATEALTENGGAEAVARGIANVQQNQAARMPGYERMRDLEEWIRRAKDGSAGQGELWAKAVYETFHGSMQAEVDKLRRDIGIASRDQNKEFIGAAIGGKDPAALAQLEKMIRENPAAFARAGVDVTKVQRGLFNALPSSIKNEADQAKGDEQMAQDFEAVQRREKAEKEAAADNARKGREADAEATRDAAVKKKAQDDADAARKRTEAEHRRRVNEVVSHTRGAYLDEATLALFESLQRGENIDRAMVREQGPLSEAIRDRGNVPADLVQDAARALLRQAREQAQNAFDSGQRPKLDQQAQRKLDGAAGKVGKAFIPQMVEYMVKNELARLQGNPEVASGPEEQQYLLANMPYSVPDQVLHNRLGREAGKYLQASGSDPRLADSLVDQAERQFQEQFTRGFATTGNEVQTLIQMQRQMLSTMTGVVSNISGQVQQLRADHQRATAHLQRSVQRAGVRLQAHELQTPSLLY